MDPELEKNLVETYPKLYRDYGGDIRHTCMGWGFTCGDGWYTLISELSQKITELDKKNRVVAAQVKEKFGGLRFYITIYDCKTLKLIPWSWWLKIPYKIRPYLTKARKFFYTTFDEKIYDIVDKAETDSYLICEKCGNPGKCRPGGWVRTLCDPCEDEYINPDKSTETFMNNK